MTKFQVFKLFQVGGSPEGISRVIKGSTAHFQGYFWKTVATLLYVNKICSNYSHLFKDFLGLCSV